ncbi:MAG: phospholipase [Verrucomicrobiae bacterium]|nr:phospholipase [Verrucomicrobiae bacterium]
MMILFVGMLLCACQSVRSLPDGLSFQGKEHPAGDLKFLKDLTYADRTGIRHNDQEIFDQWFRVIQNARRFVVIDMFLYNQFQGLVPEHTRPLAREMTDSLIAQKRRHPTMRIVIITDPVNTGYGGIRHKLFEELAANGIEVIMTDLTKLPDSNPSWSIFWRLFVRPWGNSPNGWLPTPIDHKVPLRSYLSFLNFKANHRKVLIADSGSGLAAMVTSANAHDASSAHSNVAVCFTGPAAIDLLKTENAVISFSGGVPLALPELPPSPSSKITVQVLTESKIRDHILQTLSALGPEDTLDITMLFVSDRRVIAALKDASARGVKIRILLDRNRLAFGIRRLTIPNSPVARELRKAGISIRWFEPHGEQCHSKILIVNNADGTSQISLGSANLTRRNLADLNLESNVVLRGPTDAKVFREADAWFELLWCNDPQRQFSVEYERFARRSFLETAIYHFMESSGWSAF